MAKKVTGTAGVPYGHVPGHTYCDADLEAVEGKKGATATLTITWGSAQGYDEEHGREEYSRRGSDLAEAIEAVRDAALAEQEDGCPRRRYIETAASRALDEIEKAA